MDLKQRIIEVSDELLNHLLDFKKTHPDFTFALRTRDSGQSKEKRLGSGYWFQGSHYILVPLFKRGDSSRKIKTIGFSLQINSDGTIKQNVLSISFKSGIKEENEIQFHKELAKRLNVELNDTNYGSKEYPNKENYLANLTDFIENTRPIILQLLEKYGLSEHKNYTIPEKEFQKNLSRIMKIKKQLSHNGTIDSKGNPEMKNYIDLLKYKKQIILQGPPGTGKTYNAKNMAEKLIFPNDPISLDKKAQKTKIRS